MEIEILKVRSCAYRYYTTKTRGNEGLSEDMVCRKLTRNSLLAKKLEQEEGKTLYMYGNLHMLVVNSTVVWIRNYVDRCNSDNVHPFKVNVKKKKRLNKMLGIVYTNDIYSDSSSTVSSSCSDIYKDVV